VEIIEEAIYFFDKNKKLITVIAPEDILSSQQEAELNGLITHTASGIYTDDVDAAHFFGVVDIDDANNFWLYKIDKKTVSDGQFTLNGTYVLFDDLSGRGGIIKDRRPQNESVQTILTDIIADTGWQIGQMQSTHTGTSNYYYVSKLEAFWDFLDKWDVEFKPRMTYFQGQIIGKYIDIYDRLSGDFGKWYEYGDKLLTVTKEESSTNIYTAFIGRGKGEEVGDGYGRRIGFEDVVWATPANPVNKPTGQDYVELPEATADYGFEDGTARYTTATFEDITDPVELLEATYQYALNESRPKVQFKSDVIEEGLAELGETVAIIRDDLNIRYKTRIFKLKRDFINRKVKSIEFGEELVKSQAKRNRDTLNVIKEQEQSTIHWLTLLRNIITDSYFNEDGYNYDLQAGNEYGLPGGYYSFNAPIDQNPTKVVYMGAGKILIANSKNPDGSWIWRTAATGDGIVADEVNTGKLRTVIIEGGVAPENNYWNLDTSNFRVGDADSYMQWSPSVKKFQVKNSVTGDVVELTSLGEVRSDSGATGNYALLGNGRSQYYGDTQGSLFYAGAGLDSTNRDEGGIYATYKQIFRLGRYNSFSTDVPAGEFQPYISLEYEAGDTTFDEVNGIVRVHKKLALNKSISFRGVERDVAGVNRVTFQAGGFIESHLSNSDLDISASNNLVVYASGTQAFEVDSSYMYLNRNLSMEGHDITNQSDERLKTNIVLSDYDAMSTFAQFMAKSWTWLDEERFGSQTNIGFIAQDVAAIDPTLVTQTPDEGVPDGAAWAINETEMNRRAWIALGQTIRENQALKRELSDLKKLLSDKGVI
jgi:phage minor structural protein